MDADQCPPDEASLKLVVNDVELVTIQCSPDGFDDLGVGFLYTNGVIGSFGEIGAIRFSGDESALFVGLNKAEFPMPNRLIITSGFGGGPVFSAEPPEGRVESGFNMAPDQMCKLMSAMKKRAVQYQKSGGIHAAALCSGDDIVYMAEDVGRQNSMDKVIGYCLKSGILFDNKAMLTTGRISFEMVMKTMKAGIPVLASLSAPTDKSVKQADRCGIAVAGYVTDDGFIAYTHDHRFADDLQNAVSD